MKKYSAEVTEYIKAHASKCSSREMAKKCNELFGTDLTYEKIRGFYYRHGIKAGKREKLEAKVWPPEVAQIVFENYKGRSRAEMAELLKEKTGRDYTPMQIKGFMGRHKLDSGITGRFEKGTPAWNKGKTWDELGIPEESQRRSRLTCFKKNSVSPNTCPLGTIKKTDDGYLIIKVRSKGTQWERWKLLHRKVWEEHNGPIPPGMVIAFKDGDRTNVDINNLFIMSQAENVTMNTKKYKTSNPDATMAGLQVVKLMAAVKEKGEKRNDREAGNS